MGIEALIRWPHPELNNSLDCALQWRGAGTEVPVAINLFAPSLTETSLPDRIGRALAERGVGADSLTIDDRGSTPQHRRTDKVGPE